MDDLGHRTANGDNARCPAFVSQGGLHQQGGGEPGEACECRHPPARASEDDPGHGDGTLCRARAVDARKRLDDPAPAAALVLSLDPLAEELDDEIAIGVEAFDRGDMSLV